MDRSQRLAGLCQRLDDIGEQILEFQDIDDAFGDLHTRISNLSAQLAVRKALDEIVKLVRDRKPLPVRRLGFNIKKLSETGRQDDSRWFKLQKLNFQTSIICMLSFARLNSLPSTQFDWLVQHAEHYVQAQGLAIDWPIRDQIRNVVLNTLIQEHTKEFLESLSLSMFNFVNMVTDKQPGYHKAAIQLCQTDLSEVTGEEPSSKKRRIEGKNISIRYTRSVIDYYATKVLGWRPICPLSRF